MSRLRTTIKSLLLEPRPHHLDAPEATIFHRELILRKPFLRRIYEDWYAELGSHLPHLPQGRLLELGSGGGFLQQLYPQIESSDIIPLPHCQHCCAAHQLPFERGELAGLFMVDVLHHIPNLHDFFPEAIRCLQPGGRLVLIEPANTLFSRFIYSKFHHEPFLPQAPHWHFDTSGALSGANGALPWIVFQRDRALFDTRYPQLLVRSIRLHTPFRYLLSGGLSLKSPLPAAVHAPLKWAEQLLSPLFPYLAMFQTIVVERR